MKRTLSKIGTTKPGISLIIALALAPLAALHAADATGPAVPAVPPKSTDWLKNARLGVFMHFWPNSSEDMKLVDAFDVRAVARQFKEMGVGYFVFTLGGRLTVARVGAARLWAFRPARQVLSSPHAERPDG